MTTNSTFKEKLTNVIEAVQLAVLADGEGKGYATVLSWGPGNGVGGFTAIVISGDHNDIADEFVRERLAAKELNP